MGRKKIEFTTEQDVRIKQLVNDGYSLNGILSKINDEFSTTFSRSCIDRRIKTLGIERPTQNTVLKVTGGITTLNPKLSERVEELREWKRRQAMMGSNIIITEQQIANEMGICVKTLKKMYDQFDIPQRLYYRDRPDIYFDVKQLVDCTGLKKDAREVIYAEILKRKPKDMRVQRDVVIHIEPMTINFKSRDKNGKYIKRSVDMNGVDLKVDFYFPDYKTAFCYNSFYYFKSLSKDNVNSFICSGWCQYLSEFKNEIKLMTVIPVKSVEDRCVDIEFMAKSMIDRAISGEERCWKDV